MKKLAALIVSVITIAVLFWRQFYSKIEVTFPWRGDPTVILIPLSPDDTDTVREILDKEGPRSVSTIGDAGILTQTSKLKHGNESLYKTAHKGLASVYLKKGEYLMVQCGGVCTITKIIDARMDSRMTIQKEDLHIWGEVPGQWWNR